MIGWASVEKALVAWLNTATGCTVRLADQRAPQLAYPYATIRLDGPAPVGTDDLRATSDLDKPAGEEVGLELRGQRTFTASINIYSQQKPLSATPYDHTKSARHLAELAQASLALPTPLAGLYAAGLSVVAIGPIQNLTFLQDTDHVERMQMDVRLATASSASERTGYIATVDVAHDQGGP